MTKSTTTNEGKVRETPEDDQEEDGHGDNDDDHAWRNRERRSTIEDDSKDDNDPNLHNGYYAPEIISHTKRTSPIHLRFVAMQKTSVRVVEIKIPHRPRNPSQRLV
jgi:hypothetical protein